LYILSTILYNPKGGIEREMKTLRKIRKDAKALSPVVASIILIAVTVAVSIAVAAWMGALSIGFMETEQISITNAQFDVGNDQVTLTLSNTGTTDVSITSAVINGENAVAFTDPVPVLKNSVGTTVTVSASQDIQSGDTYQIRLLSAKGNYFPYNAVAP
jgi:flagellin-like protein